jgi:hypothetical protein
VLDQILGMLLLQMMQRAPGGSVFRLHLQHATVGLLRLSPAPLFLQQPPQPVMALHVFGMGQEILAKGLLRRLPIAHGLTDLGQFAIQVHPAGVLPETFLQQPPRLEPISSPKGLSCSVEHGPLLRLPPEG